MKIKLISALLFSIAMFSQETTSSLTGKIQVDDEMASHVELSLLHIPTNYLYETETDDTGNYKINNIDPGGPYKLTILVNDIEYYKTYDYLILGDNEVKKIKIITK